MSYDRANKKLCEAIDALATSAHATLQQRLAIVYLFHLRSVEPDDPPIEVESPFKTLKEKLTRLATGSIPFQDAIEIAKELVRIAHMVDGEHHRVECQIKVHRHKGILASGIGKSYGTAAATPR